MMNSHSIRGGGDLRLHVREWGNPSGIPILLIHGWSASHMVWNYQYQSALRDEFRLVALDLRGHGMSDMPDGVEHYNSETLWADDVASIIEYLNLDRPVLVGWSYGGLVIGDYVRRHGESGISGVNYVGAAVALNAEAMQDLLGPGFLDHVEDATQPDLPGNIEAIRKFLRELVVTPMKSDDHERALAFNMTVPPTVRGNMLQRAVDTTDVLARMNVPVLVTQGRQDQHVLPAMAERILEVCPTARVSWFEDVAHMPFMEDWQRYNTELADFARAARH